ncbi:MAG: penicillin acylase family protein [Verrucomicrobiales bacterium]|nr:penicillin acylase family protein [Verrucomicrobiales bacterium]
MPQPPPATTPSAPAGAPRSASWRRTALVLLLAVLTLILLLGATVTYLLRASLPQLDGTAAVTGLQDRVEITRDALGVPSIRAQSRADALRALGFLHAQERFFQMDLLRRRGAGELAALVGPALVEHDRVVRRHRLRAAAQQDVADLPQEHASLLAAYTEGVNQGLHQLGARPPEYWALQSKPEPWRPEDSLLVGYAMSFTLQDADGISDLIADRLTAALPRDVAEFLVPATSSWDAPIDHSLIPHPTLPPPTSLDLRLPPPPPSPSPAAALPHPTPPTNPEVAEGAPVPGSNSWGVPGRLTDSGAAMIANDMHLDLGVPNIWYRAEIQWTQPDGQRRRLIGVTLPGVPSLIVGSNGDIAWAFTNATLDTSDLIDLETDPAHPHAYRTPQGWTPFETFTESIAVRGAPLIVERYTNTLWGPLPPASSSAPRQALRWIAHQRDATNLRLLDLAVARSTEEALALAPRIGIPAQNLLVGDRTGALAWTLIGRLPRRVGFAADSPPTSWADGSRRWEGWLPPEAYPVVRARDHGLWTANNRISGPSNYLALGVHTTDLGARATQIRDDLHALPSPVHEPDLLSIHRDDRALFLARWQQLLLRTLETPSPQLTEPRRLEALDAVTRWGARASVDSAGYRLVRDFRYQALHRVLEPIFQRCQPPAGSLALPLLTERNEDAAWSVLSEQPAHLLNPAFTNLHHLLADAARATVERVAGTTGAVHTATWGRRNTSHLQHPLSRGVPQLARWLDLPRQPLPGDDHMPRVQGPGFGASERLVVSPGREESGLFHMPGGQSGHFLSPFYHAGHQAWVEVSPTPLLPGPTQHTLTLIPAKKPETPRPAGAG